MQWTEETALLSSPFSIFRHLPVFSQDLKRNVTLFGSPKRSQVVNKTSVYVSLKVISIICYGDWCKYQILVFGKTDS